MSSTDRRRFLEATVATAALPALASASSRVRAASDEVTLGLIGCGGRGRGLAETFHAIDGAAVRWVCDADRDRAERVAAQVGDARVAADPRRIADAQEVDAVLVATPDHWHVPASLLALQAGKHVYVEKPCSHNLREGRMLVEAADRSGRVLQHGTQSRAHPLVVHAVQLLRDGVIGDVLVAKAWNVQRRGPIGKRRPAEAPPQVNYDLWVGPAPFVPYQENRFHYNWHWWYDFGTGDMGNDGVHELDIARWGLGVEGHPERVAACGGKLAFDDDQQFPDTQYAAFDYPDSTGERKQLIFEMRLWSRYGMEGADNGNAFYGTKGWMMLSKRGILRVYDERNQPIALPEAPPVPRNYFENFVAAIRGESTSLADALTAHWSASLCHLGNVATRLGRSLDFDPETENVRGDEEANRLLGREYRDHWSTPRSVAARRTS